MWFWGLKENICKMTTSHITTTILRRCKYAFLPCGHLDIWSAVVAQNDEFRSTHACWTSKVIRETPFSTAILTDELVECISYALWAIKWLGTIPSVLDHQSNHSTLRQWWRQISHLRPAWFRRWTLVLPISGSTRRCRNRQTLCHSRIHTENTGDDTKEWGRYAYFK